MSKRTFKKTTEQNRVIAFAGRVIKNNKGEVVKQFYNIFKLH